MDAAQIRELVLEEGTVLHVYDDATGAPIVPGYHVVGHPTIGVGRSLDIQGITTAESAFLLDNNLAAIDQALRIYPWWLDLSPVRQFVICDMSFNLGISGLLKFHRMIKALSDSNYSLAATEMLASAWATQLPTRAHRLATMMRTGQFATKEGS